MHERAKVALWAVGLAAVDQLLVFGILEKFPQWAHETDFGWFTRLPLWISFLIAGGMLAVFIGRALPLVSILLAAGLLSNVASVLLRGAVVDYVPFGPFATNPADAMVVAGILIHILRRPGKGAA